MWEMTTISGSVVTVTGWDLSRLVFAVFWVGAVCFPMMKKALDANHAFKTACLMIFITTCLYYALGYNYFETKAKFLELLRFYGAFFWFVFVGLPLVKAADRNGNSPFVACVAFAIVTTILSYVFGYEKL